MFIYLVFFRVFYESVAEGVPIDSNIVYIPDCDVYLRSRFSTIEKDDGFY